jgi:hypothetical protein
VLSSFSFDFILISRAFDNINQGFNIFLGIEELFLDQFELLDFPLIFFIPPLDLVLQFLDDSGILRLHIGLFVLKFNNFGTQYFDTLFFTENVTMRGFRFSRFTVELFLKRLGSIIAWGFILGVQPLRIFG